VWHGVPPPMACPARSCARVQTRRVGLNCALRRATGGRPLRKKSAISLTAEPSPIWPSKETRPRTSIPKLNAGGRLKGFGNDCVTPSRVSFNHRRVTHVCAAIAICNAPSCAACSRGARTARRAASTCGARCGGPHSRTGDGRPGQARRGEPPARSGRRRSTALLVAAPVRQETHRLTDSVVVASLVAANG
jgi:hypothetical protein